MPSDYGQDKLDNNTRRRAKRLFTALAFFVQKEEPKFHFFSKLLKFDFCGSLPYRIHHIGL